MPALTEPANPCGEIRIMREGHLKAAQGLLHLAGLMAGNDDHALGLRGQRLLGHDPHQRLAAEFGQQLVRAAHPGGAAGREDDRGDVAAVVNGKALARLRPCHDFHQ